MGRRGPTQHDLFTSLHLLLPLPSSLPSPSFPSLSLPSLPSSALTLIVLPHHSLRPSLDRKLFLGEKIRNMLKHVFFKKHAEFFFLKCIACIKSNDKKEKEKISALGYRLAIYFCHPASGQETIFCIRMA